VFTEADICWRLMQQDLITGTNIDAFELNMGFQRFIAVHDRDRTGNIVESAPE